jgi:5'-3' exonuclease
MHKLSAKTIAHFGKDDSGLNIIVSTSNECGEGEHKMFHHIRNQTFDPDDTAFIYGLDSDLIMLSIFHCKFFKEIYIFREAPEFTKSLGCVPKGLESEHKSCYFMDIMKLSRSILSEMRCGYVEQSRIYDYVVLCFFLGNDFLPHFPSLNIRTNGMQILLDTYRKFIGNYADRGFVSPISGKIQWKYLSIFIEELAKSEHDYILGEYEIRKKWDKRHWLIESDEDRGFTMQSVPVIYRSEESYICPTEKGWESRYYKSLFHETNVTSICENYLEGLEWVYKYYTVDCPDWKWKYNYHYPPLMKDLCKNVPSDIHANLISKNRGPVNSTVQLAYVLPRCHHSIIPGNKAAILESDKFKHLYPLEYNYKWAFCRYLWEAHVDLPEISERMLNELQIVLAH